MAEASGRSQQLATVVISQTGGEGTLDPLTASLESRCEASVEGVRPTRRVPRQSRDRSGPL